MSERKARVFNGPAEKVKCSACGATLPWHFRDCPSVPGGRELSLRDIDDKAKWAEEKRVPKEQGVRILKAIMAMLDSPSHEIMLERKAAIQEEIAKL